MKAKTTARSCQTERRGPGLTSTMTRPTAVTVMATACPEGKEEPLVDTSACGGRDRAYPAFSFPIKYSELATATAKAVSCTHRRRQASSRAAAARNGQLTPISAAPDRQQIARTSARRWLV